jgi:hypothetical protein
MKSLPYIISFAKQETNKKLPTNKTIQNKQYIILASYTPLNIIQQ